MTFQKTQSPTEGVGKGASNEDFIVLGDSSADVGSDIGTWRGVIRF